MSFGYLSDWHFPLIIAVKINICHKKCYCGRKNINGICISCHGLCESLTCKTTDDIWRQTIQLLKSKATLYSMSPPVTVSTSSTMIKAYYLSKL